LAPEASLIEMHMSIDPELVSAPYEATALVTPQVLVLRDESNYLIAEQLIVKPRTIHYHLQNIYTKLGVQQRGQAIAWAIRAGLAGE
jgi:hypothetical protein